MSTINKQSILTQLQTLLDSVNVSTETTDRLLLLLKTSQNADILASTIITEIISRIESVDISETLQELVLLAVGAKLSSTNRFLAVPSLTELNALQNISTGSIYFVESENLPYIRKSNNTWVLIDPSLQPFPLENAYSWGSSFDGQLGDGTTISKSSPVSVLGGFTDWVEISAAKRSSLGLRANGTAWSWGFNTSGRLGDGTTISRSSPVSVVGGFTDWKQLSILSYHAIGIRANGSAWVWGRNIFGELGINEGSGYRSSPVSVVGGFTDWTQASAGDRHSMAIRANGTLWVWGSGGEGRLGDDTTVSRSSPVSIVGGFTDWVQVSAGEQHSSAIRVNGTAWTWGRNHQGRLGDGTTIHRSSPVSVVGGFTDWTQVSAGRGHTIALRANGTAWAWGYANEGRLGSGGFTTTSSPVSVVGGFTDWVHLSANYHNIGIRANGSAWSWGPNSAGQLGDNTTVSKNSPVSVVGGFNDWINASAAVTHSLGVRGS